MKKISKISNFVLFDTIYLISFPHQSIYMNETEKFWKKFLVGGLFMGSEKC